jgi:hypothetical protein
VHRRVPLAAWLFIEDDRPSQPPEPSLPLVSGQRRPAVRVRVETGLWRAALRMRDGRGVQAPSPWRTRIVNARPSSCRTMPPAADRRPCPGGRMRHATACRMWTSSGDTRAAREPRHRLFIFHKAKPAGGPPECKLTPRRFSRGVAFACLGIAGQLWAKMSVSSQPRRSSLARVGRNSKQALA